MKTKVLSQKLVLLVIGLTAGSGILIPASYASFHPVTSSEIQDGTIQTADLANNAVTSAKIKDGEVKAVDIGGGAVNSAKIADNSITAADIGSGAVTNAKLANGAVDSAKIADNSITAADIGASAVGESEIGPNAVGAGELQGVTKLMFIDCPKTVDLSVAPGNVVSVPCTAPGTDVDDLVIASHNGSTCFPLIKADSQAGYVSLFLFNRCSASQAAGTLTFSIIVYDT